MTSGAYVFCPSSKGRALRRFLGEDGDVRMAEACVEHELSDRRAWGGRFRVLPSGRHVFTVHDAPELFLHELASWVRGGIVDDTARRDLTRARVLVGEDVIEAPEEEWDGLPHPRPASLRESETMLRTECPSFVFALGPTGPWGTPEVWVGPALDEEEIAALKVRVTAAVARTGSAELVMGGLVRPEEPEGHWRFLIRRQDYGCWKRTLSRVLVALGRSESSPLSEWSRAMAVFDVEADEPSWALFRPGIELGTTVSSLQRMHDERSVGWFWFAERDVSGGPCFYVSTERRELEDLTRSVASAESRVMTGRARFVGPSRLELRRKGGVSPGAQRRILGHVQGLAPLKAWQIVFGDVR